MLVPARVAYNKHIVCDNTTVSDVLLRSVIIVQQLTSFKKGNMKMRKIINHKCILVIIVSDGIF